MPIHEASPGLLTGAWVVFGADSEGQGLPWGKVRVFLAKGACPYSVAFCGSPAFHGEGAAAPFPLSLDEYLELVDATGRIVKSGKRGSIPKHLLPILTRLKIDAERWVDLMLRKEGFWGTAIGSALNRATEAARRGVKWIAEKICIHAPEVAT